MYFNIHSSLAFIIEKNSIDPSIKFKVQYLLNKYCSIWTVNKTTSETRCMRVQQRSSTQRALKKCLLQKKGAICTRRARALHALFPHDIVTARLSLDILKISVYFTKYKTAQCLSCPHLGSTMPQTRSIVYPPHQFSLSFLPRCV